MPDNLKPITLSMNESQINLTCKKCNLNFDTNVDEFIESELCPICFTKQEKKKQIELGLAKCGVCNETLTRIDDPYDGFCSERCSKQYDVIKSLSIRDLNHICIWYYVQSLGQKRITEKEVSKLDRRCNRNKLIQKLSEAYK